MRFCFDTKDFVDTDLDNEKIAVIGVDTELSWKEFEVRVNNLCDWFVQEGYINLKYPVIVYGHKKANMLVAFYAMMKLEIPYIPLDVIYPKERVSKILHLSKSQIIINTTAELLDFENTTEVVLGNETIKDIKCHEKLCNSPKLGDPLVYTIFTSGSTGEPKGVQIGTEAVQSFTRWMTKDFNFGANDVFINSAVLSFDLSVFEVMTFGAIGGTILLNSKEITSDPAMLMPRIKKYGGSVWVSTPSFALLYSRMENNIELNSLNTFLFCGEVLPHGLAKNLLKYYPKAKVINTYGPTEATVATTRIEITEEVLTAYDPLPVGISKGDSKLLIVDEEIIIVGPNVSSGYLNAPELNDSKFITIDGQRAFKTGDKGALKGNMLFFSGRNDDMVKLHGYRIELNEITSAICNLDYVVQAETIALKRNGIVKKIVSLIQAKENYTIQIEELKTELAKTLPVYMVPSGFKFLNEIPLNQNGKADKKLLTQLFLQK